MLRGVFLTELIYVGVASVCTKETTYCAPVSNHARYLSAWRYETSINNGVAIGEHTGTRPLWFNINQEIIHGRLVHGLISCIYHALTKIYNILDADTNIRTQVLVDSVRNWGFFRTVSSSSTLCASIINHL